MTTECSRAWQAEAALDGRLSRADAESFQRHAATCDHCAREVRALDALHTVGQSLPILTSTPLEQRRLRQSVLRAANELALGPRPAPRKHALAFGALAVAAVVVALLVLWRPAARESEPVVAVGVPTYQVQTSKDAAWTTRNHETTARLLLKSGWFELSVDKLRARQRFLLELPDGELEVKGTRFSVEVRDARTARVRVHEGRVALRLRGQPSMLLEAGDTWPAVAAAASATSPPVALSAAPVASMPETARVRAPRTASPPPAPPTGSKTEAPTDSIAPAGDAFAQAMSAFGAGDFGKAERLFAAFERAHPADARVEDATFLRAVARARRGDAAAAQAIARDYLHRYPNGLRRAEAERLLR